MKTVFQNASAVIHLFAQRTQNEARSSNVFFEREGKRLYSYGHHYLLAEFIENENGEMAIMINDSGYSNTTAKHIGHTISATRQFKQFFTTNCDEVKVFRQLENLATKLMTARKPEIYIDQANNLYFKFLEFKNWKNSEVINKNIIIGYFLPVV